MVVNSKLKLNSLLSERERERSYQKNFSKEKQRMEVVKYLEGKKKKASEFIFIYQIGKNDGKEWVVYLFIYRNYC